MKDNIGVVVPPSIQRRAGFKPGDRLGFEVSEGVIKLVPKLLKADGEYAPEQRKLIDAQIKEARQGSYFGPFETSEELAAHVEGQIKKRATPKRRSGCAT